MNCPNCNGKRRTQLRGDVYECRKCGAIFGRCYLGDSYGFVLPYFVAQDIPAEATRYYDFECLGSKGLTRRHGWFDPSSKRIVQVG